MLRHALAVRRSAVVLGAGLLAGLVLTGCGGATPTRTVTAAATGSAPSSSDESTPPDSPLTKGLLSAEQLGADDVHQFLLDGDGDPDHHGGPWGWGSGDAQVTPEGCATAVQDAMSNLPGLQDGVGQVARADDVRTFEVLAVPESPVKAVDELRALQKACDGATIDRSDGDEDHGSVTVKISELSGAPDQTAAFSVTVSGQHNDGTWSMTALLGVGNDGNRVLGLAQMSWDKQLDTASFTGLLGTAYQVQHDALG